MDNGIDWRLTTWEGSRREQLRRWAALPLEQIIQAIEDMGEFGGALLSADASKPASNQPPVEYNTKTKTMDQ